MNAKQMIAAVAVFAATSSAFASEWVDFSGFQSTKSRAEVVAELRNARSEGSYVVGGTEFAAPDAGFVGSKSRAQVVAELKQSKSDGSYAQAHQEYDGQAPAQYDGASRLAAGSSRPAM